MWWDANWCSTSVQTRHNRTHQGASAVVCSHLSCEQRETASILLTGTCPRLGIRDANVGEMGCEPSIFCRGGTAPQHRCAIRGLFVHTRLGNHMDQLGSRYDNSKSCFFTLVSGLYEITLTSPKGVLAIGKIDGSVFQPYISVQSFHFVIKLRGCYLYLNP
jgi:hypothetical protein